MCGLEVWDSEAQWGKRWEVLKRESKRLGTVRGSGGRGGRC